MIDPIQRFEQLLERALKLDLPEPTAMALATAGADGRPSVRMVLLKGLDASGFVFYTNLESQKGRDLSENPWAALCFFWQPLLAQVRAEGVVARITDAEANAYFASRPRGSQIGAWASLQSSPLGSFAELGDRVSRIEQSYLGMPVPRPDYWSGYRLVPERMEFWSGRPDRLHERELYTRDSPEAPWEVQLLYP